MADAPFTFLPLGAIIQSIRIKGTNIVLGFATQDQYAEHNTPYFGETIGRVANRIKDARIDSLNGTSYSLAANNGPNCLHGGNVGWGKRIWTGPVPVGTAAPTIPGVDGFTRGKSVAYSLVSQHGDEGFPGTVEAKVIYTAGTQDVDGREAIVLGIEYEAGLVGGADETVINMTNHSYFNLSGDATIAGTSVTLATRNHLPFDSSSVPTGSPVHFPAFDTAKPFVLGAAGPDVDNCFTVATDASSVPIDTRGQPLVRNLSAHHPKTGIHLDVLSTEPAFQFYTGHFTDVPPVGGAPARGPRSAFCCEPGRFVNACNVPEWRGMTVLRRGELYGARIVYRIWAN
ncbi:aldose 1-epimerase domain-containing protein [Hirsutella rhossiliensis]|uniref:Aldose 1-epimerase domain-containing protein n=1 Tax=Hirsutella rhossiliensis TaxID=111463 RepID=A0A9P8SKN6_9HYPO|nr:aldose 1-epimerase domain-containing protein [Hirsutella rhossiliensis]KAH0965419.1 aldose 1-epimerase domain-containing protein [Hirsutella rhossiliensis]